MDVNVRNLLDALKQIRIERYSKHTGICYNLICWNDYNRTRWVKISMAEELFKKWPEYSGCEEYPVPGVDGMSAEETYDSTEYPWDGEYGEYRLRLLNFMIETLEGGVY